MANTFDESIEELYDCALSNSGWSRWMDGMVHRFGGVGGLVAATGCDLDVLGMPGYDAQTQRAYAEHFFSQDLWAIRADRRPGALYRSDHDIPEQQFAESAIFQDLLRPWNGAFHCIGTVSPIGPPTGLALAGREKFIFGIHRAQRHPFSDDEARDVVRIVRHVSHALAVRRRLRDADTSTRAGLAALDHLLVGVVVAEASGAVRYANRSAQVMDREGDGLVLRDRSGKLAAGHGVQTEVLHRLIATAAGAGRSGAIALSRPSGRRPWQVLVAPMSEQAAGRPGALVLIGDPADAAPYDLAAIRGLLGLTAAEAAVVSALAAGDDLKAIADQRGVAIGTLRVQLRDIFEKTGVRRQSDLLRLVLRGPLGATRSGGG